MRDSKELDVVVAKYEDFCVVHGRIMEVITDGVHSLKMETEKKKAEVFNILRNASEGVERAVALAPHVVPEFVRFLDRVEKTAAQGAIQLQRLKVDKEKEKKELDEVLKKYKKRARE